MVDFTVPVADTSGFTQGFGELLAGQAKERKAQEDIATAEELFNDEQTFMDIVNDDKFMALAQRNPQLAKVGMEIAMTRDNQIMQSAQREINNDAAFAVSLLDLDNAGRKTALIQKAKQWMVESQDASPERRDTLMAKAEEAARLSTLDAPSLQAELTEDALLSDLYTDFMKGRMNGQSRPARVEAFSQLTESLTPDEKERARRIELGLEPRAVGSAVQTITSRGTAEAIAETEETLAESKETGKLKAQKEYKPLIEAAVAKAKEKAKEEGVSFTELKRAEAALPGLLEVVGKLKQLAPVATSNLAGRAFDTVVKELGFGSTKGATARAKFIAIVNNQVLPLLKPTFGAAFTVQEGQELKSTLGDPNVPEAEKIAQLEAFIDQKVRNIEGLRSELDQPERNLFSQVLNREITEQDIQETLEQTPGMTREELLQKLQVK